MTVDGAARTRGRPQVARERGWKAVAIPNEHGGWGLTLEPAVLAMLVSPSISGLLLSALALVAFVARTPLRVILVDTRRGRNLERTALARRILAGEVLLLSVLAGTAGALGDLRMWWPLVGAIPLIGVELWFDMRSRSRRLIPELAGPTGVSLVASMIVLAAGSSVGLAAALWLILSARVVTAIPFVRAQIAMLHARRTSPSVCLAADAAALALAVLAVAVHRSTMAGAAAIVALVIYQRVTASNPPERAAILGVRQTVLGLTVVLVTGLGVLAPW